MEITTHPTRAYSYTYLIDCMIRTFCINSRKKNGLLDQKFYSKMYLDSEMKPCLVCLDDLTHKIRLNDWFIIALHSKAENSTVRAVRAVKPHTKWMTQFSVYTNKIYAPSKWNFNGSKWRLVLSPRLDLPL